MPKLKKGDAIVGQVKRWALGKSKNKGTPFIRVTFTGGHNWTGYLTPNTHETVLKQLGIMGFKGSNLKMLKNDDALKTDKDLSLVLGESREYQGKTYWDIDWVNKIGGCVIEDESVLDYFDFDTRAYISDTQDIDPPAATEKQDTHFTASDIPF